MKIVFMGTPDFAVPSLNALVRAGYEVVGVFCQPDRPKGRGGGLAECSVKQAALLHGLPVVQPERIRGQAGLDALRAFAPDLCVTAAFGQILSAKNLEVPPLGTVNVHASLLPKYRGAAPIQRAIINGETCTGVTTMYTALGVDTGDIILQRKTSIHPEETAGMLFERLAELGAQTLLETIELIKTGKAPRVPQNEAEATHCSMIQKNDGRIDFGGDAVRLRNFIRGMNPWPGAFICIDNITLKVHEVHVVYLSGEPGTVLHADNEHGLVIACGQNALEITCLQAPGKRAMSAKEYLRGHPISAGAVSAE